jgi:hypothetical protein
LFLKTTSIEKRNPMSNATLRGIVHLIEDTKTFGQKGFRKRTVVLEQNLGRFTNYIPLDFIGDACDSADALSVGDDITVNYRLSGRKWQRDPQSEVKYFLSAEALSFRRSAEAASGGSSGSLNDEFSQASSDDTEDAPF